MTSRLNDDERDTLSQAIVDFCKESASYLTHLQQTATAEAKLSVIAIVRIVALLFFIGLMIIVGSVVAHCLIAYLLAVQVGLGWTLSLVLLVLADGAAVLWLFARLSKFSQQIGFARTRHLIVSSATDHFSPPRSSSA